MKKRCQFYASDPCNASLYHFRAAFYGRNEQQHPAELVHSHVCKTINSNEANQSVIWLQTNQ